jgi:predicted PurR-regulated permease PerM
MRTNATTHGSTEEVPKGEFPESSAGAPPAVLTVRNRILNYSLWVLMILSICVILRYAKEVFVPVVLAIFIAYILDPMVGLLARLRVPRSVAAAVVLLGVLGIAAGGLYGMRGQIAAMLDNLPRSAQKLRAMLQESQGASSDGQSALDKVKQAANELERAAGDVSGSTRVQPEEPLFSAREYLWVSSRAFFVFLTQATVVLFLAYFLLASGKLYKRKIVKLVGSRLSEKRVTVEVLDEIETQIKRYVLIQVAICAGVGAAIGLALWYLGLHEPAVWGLLSGVLNSVPYFGPILATVGVVLASFLQFGTLSEVTEVAAVVILLTTLDGYFLKPVLTGRAARINQIALFVALLFWTWIWGIAGMLLAVPIMVVIKTICDRIPELHPVSELLGE